MTVHAARMGNWNRYLIRILLMNDRCWLADSYVAPQHVNIVVEKRKRNAQFSLELWWAKIMRTTTPQHLCELQKNPKNIRNICILAHVDHGKLQSLIFTRAYFFFWLVRHWFFLFVTVLFFACFPKVKQR